MQSPITHLVDSLGLSRTTYLNLKCAVKSRKELLARLDPHLSPEMTAEVYSYLLQVEIQELLGRDYYYDLERDLASLPDIKELVNRLLDARVQDKLGILQSYLRRYGKKRSFYGDVLLPRRVAEAIEWRDRKELTIALIHQQLDNALFGADLSHVLENELIPAYPNELEWVQVDFDIVSPPCPEQVSFCVSARPKRYTIKYPNYFSLTQEGYNKIQTMLYGDLVLSRLACLFGSSFPSYNRILKRGSHAYFNKLACVACLRAVLSLIPEDESDRQAIALLQADLVKLYRPQVCNLYPDCLDDLIRADPNGFLTVVAFSLDRDGNIIKENLDLMVANRRALLRSRRTNN